MAQEQGMVKTILAKQLNIVWGKDERYWRLPEKDDDPAELLQVTWLEVTATARDLQRGKKYSVGFSISLKEEQLYGWNTPVFLMAKVGKGGRYRWKKLSIDTTKKGGSPFDVPGSTSELIVEIPTSGDNTLYFGLYEVWSGKWKSGMKIHHAFAKVVV